MHRVAKVVNELTLLKGAAGVSIMEVVHQVDIPDWGAIESIVKIALQAIVALSTLWYTIKKPKPKNDKTN